MRRACCSAKHAGRWAAGVTPCCWRLVFFAQYVRSSRGHVSRGERGRQSHVRALASWIRPSCDVATATLVCAGCGERAHAARDRTRMALLAQLAQAASNVEGRVLRPVRLLLTQPGAPPVAFRRGQRVAPLRALGRPAVGRERGGLRRPPVSRHRRALRHAWRRTIREVVVLTAAVAGILRGHHFVVCVITLHAV